MRNETAEQTCDRLCGEALETIAERYNLTIQEMRFYHQAMPFTFYALCTKENNLKKVDD